MCTASQTYIDCAFHLSPSMQVTCTCGWGGSHTSDIFKSSALQHPDNAQNSDYEVCQSSDTEVFEMASSFLENVWTPAIVCIVIHPFIRIFYGVGWLIAVQKLLETYNFN
jgi:hypothetical protein